MTSIIKNRTIVTADRTYKVDVLIDAGKITAIGRGGCVMPRIAHGTCGGGGGFTPPHPRGIFGERGSRAAGLALALALCVPSAAQAGACDSTMMALIFLGDSVDPILAGAADVPDRLATFAERAKLAEADATAEGWPADVLANLALLSAAGAASPPETIFTPAQAVADSAGTLCEGYPMPYFPAN